jgi:hypothetical protein
MAQLGPDEAAGNFHPRGTERAAERGLRRAGSGHAFGPGITSVVMRHRAARALPAVASVLVAGIAMGGCATATATGGTTSARPAASAASSAASASGAAAPGAAASGAATGRAGGPVYGPPGPDPACATALKAEQTLRTRQGRDQASQSALDRDFTNFANALSTAAQQERHPATATAMTALASDYTALVESQSGAAELPDMSTVENDGTAFDKACS